MPTVKLYDGVGLGLIIKYKSGIIYQNQTGGTACMQPAMEGAYIPLRNEYTIPDLIFQSPEIELWNYFTGPRWKGTGATTGIDEEDADFIESALVKAKLDHCIEINRNMLNKSMEAWIHVTVKSDEDESIPIFFEFGPYPREGVLTWSNSD